MACSKTTNTPIITDTISVIDTIASTPIETIPMPTDTFNIDRDSQAVVENVSFSGNEEEYSFSVQLKSPDTGCDQYADWWEVFGEDGTLLYRRILLHSHVNEQPFSRSGGPIKITADTFVYIRAHMNNLGYGSLVMGGTVKDGFEAIELPVNFAADLATTSPLPDGCAF